MFEAYYKGEAIKASMLKRNIDKFSLEEITEAQNRNEVLCRPEGGHPVFYTPCEKIRPHFRHFSESSCRGETSEHAAAKDLFIGILHDTGIFSTVKDEYSSCRRRFDVYGEGSPEGLPPWVKTTPGGILKVGVEVQYSNQSIEELLQRLHQGTEDDTYTLVTCIKGPNFSPTKSRMGDLRRFEGLIHRLNGQTLYFVEGDKLVSYSLNNGEIAQRTLYNGGDPTKLFMQFFDQPYLIATFGDAHSHRRLRYIPGWLLRKNEEVLSPDSENGNFDQNFREPAYFDEGEIPKGVHFSLFEEEKVEVPRPQSTGDSVILNRIAENYGGQSTDTTKDTKSDRTFITDKNSYLKMDPKYRIEDIGPTLKKDQKSMGLLARLLKFLSRIISP